MASPSSAVTPQYENVGPSRYRKPTIAICPLWRRWGNSLIVAATRSRKYRIMTTLERPGNRLTRFALRRGFAPRAFALLETVGRRSGQPRHTPVGNGLTGDTFWLVAAHGTQADYVLNIKNNPRVRVKVGRSWRTGTAVLLPDDDPEARSRTLPYRWDAAIGRAMASRPLTVRIDLDRMGS